MKLHIYTEDRPWTAEVAVWILTEDANGNRHVCKPIDMVFEPHNPGTQTEPSMRFSGFMSREFFPALHDALIRSGYIKPQEAHEVKAMQAHIDSLRMVVDRTVKP